MTCAACVHWTELNRRERKPERMGRCIAASCFTDMVIRGGQGCGECDPYSMSEPELHTAATFSCQHFKQKGQR